MTQLGNASAALVMDAGASFRNRRGLLAEY